MARGSLKDPFKKQEETPMKQVSGQQIGSTLGGVAGTAIGCLLYTSPSPRDVEESRMPSSA